MDRVSAMVRSRIMAAVRQRNGGPERVVGRALRGMHLRFRKHVRDLPGTPDFVLCEYGLAIFVNGCFWHGHSCKIERMPKSNKSYWQKKIADNKRRDQRVQRALRRVGYSVIVVWECETRTSRAVRRIAGAVCRNGLSDRSRLSAR